MITYARSLGRIPARLVALCEAQNWRCCYCGVVFLINAGPRDHSPSFDEVVPQSEGGAKTWDNQVAACRGCNSTRGNQDAESFYLDVALQRTTKGKWRLRLAAEARYRPADVSKTEKLRNLKAAAEAVAMTPARAAYFRAVYGFVPGDPSGSETPGPA